MSPSVECRRHRCPMRCFDLPGSAAVQSVDRSAVQQRRDGCMSVQMLDV